MVWAQLEHLFRAFQLQFEYLRTRYRGLAKKRAQLRTLFTVCNLFLV